VVANFFQKIAFLQKKFQKKYVFGFLFFGENFFSRNFFSKNIFEKNFKFF